MTERNYRLIQPTDEYPTMSWCVTAVLDCLSKKNVPLWAYGQYYFYYEKRWDKSTTGGLYRYIMEKCIRDADGKDHDYIEYYLSTSADETMVLLKLFRERGYRVLMTSEADILSVRREASVRWLDKPGVCDIIGFEHI